MSGNPPIWPGSPAKATRASGASRHRPARRRPTRPPIKTGCRSPGRIRSDDPLNHPEKWDPRSRRPCQRSRFRTCRRRALPEGSTGRGCRARDTKSRYRRPRPGRRRRPAAGRGIATVCRRPGSASILAANGGAPIRYVPVPTVTIPPSTLPQGPPPPRIRDPLPQAQYVNAFTPPAPPRTPDSDGAMFTRTNSS